MRIVFTRHAEEKLLRKDIVKFKVDKNLVAGALKSPDKMGRTKHGEYTVIIFLNGHILRVVYDRIGGKAEEFNVIAFHIARKGRYET